MIDNYFSPDTCALVTTYCPEPFSDKKLHMTKTICEKLKQAGFFVCLSSHSVLSEEFQELVDFFIYDKDNTFKIGKYPEHVINHGVGEFKLIHDAIGSLKRFNFKYLYKFAYDVNPQLNFIDILNKCKAMDKKLISANWNDVYPKNSIGALAFFSEIDFFIETLSLDEIYRFNDSFEMSWFSSVTEKQKKSDIFLYDSYREFFGVEKVEFSHSGGAILSEGYGV